MIEFVVQASALAAFLAGVMLAEFITFRAFGRPKRAVIAVDVLLFVLLATTMYYYLEFFDVDAYFYLANFFVGMISIVFVRAIEAALGCTEKAHSREGIADALIPILVKTGMDADEIKQSLRTLGISDAKIEKLSAKIDRSIPAYLPKIVRIYDELDEIKTQLARISGSRRGGKSRARPRPRSARPRQKPNPANDTLSGIQNLVRAAVERAERAKREAESAAGGAQTN